MSSFCPAANHKSHLQIILHCCSLKIKKSQKSKNLWKLSLKNLEKWTELNSSTQNNQPTHMICHPLARESDPCVINHWIVNIENNVSTYFWPVSSGIPTRIPAANLHSCSFSYRVARCCLIATTWKKQRVNSFHLLLIILEEAIMNRA